MHDPSAGDDQLYVIGVDLGGTKIRAGIASSQGSILASRTVPTIRGGAAVSEQLARLIQDLSGDAGVSPQRIAATGIGAAGVADLVAGGFSRAPNLDLMGGAGFQDSLAHELGHQVVIENDVNVAALGELHGGLGRQFRDFVCISIGTGVGMGIVVDGRLWRGAHGAAGEIGYLPLGTDPLDRAHHRRGPLEEMLAGDRLAQRYSRSAGRAASAETVFEQALLGDSDASESIEIEAKWLAHAIVAVNAVLDTQAVVLAGGIGQRPELVDRTLAWMRRLGLTGLPVVSSTLGPDGPIAGAVRLALDAMHCELKGSLR